MSTEQANGKTVEEKKKDDVAEVTEKLENLAVDNTEANERRSANGGARRGNGRGFRGGRGRGRGGRMGTRVPRPPYEEQVKKIADELAAKKVLETGVKGHVKWFSVRGRYGFLARTEPKNESEDFFVHQTAITNSNTNKFYLRSLDEGEEVVFDIVEGDKGPEAANVSGPNGEAVKGSRFARHMLYRFRRGGRGRGRGGAPRGGDRKTEDAEKQPEQQEGAPEGEKPKKRRPNRARGKLNPDAPEGEKPQEKGDGDAAAAPADGEKKGRRRFRNNKGKKSGEKQEGADAPAPAAPAQQA